MADTSTPFGTITTGQGSQEVKANGLFDAVSPAATYGLKSATVSNLSISLHGGKVIIAGVVTTIADYTGTLAASATSYVEANPGTGAFSKNTVAYTPGYIKIGRAVAGASTFTWTDDRGPRLSGTLAKTLPSDAAYTLTADEADNAVLSISGTLTAARDIVVPLVGKRQWTVYNGTGQSLRFIGPSGTGITVATVKHAIVRSDGTNIVRVTADV